MVKKKRKVKQRLEDLEELFEEAKDYIGSLQNSQNYYQKELYYLQCFISYKKLDEEYSFFKAHAHEEKEENMPFPFLTL